MARLASLAAARAWPLRPALRRPLFRFPLGRALVAGGLVLAAIGAAYLVARETSLFAIEDLDIRGASAEVHLDVRHAVDELQGTSLVKIDSASLERRLRELPSVVDAQVDRSFPDALRILVKAEQPLALVTDHSVVWVVSRHGRVIRPVEPGARLRLPRVWSASAARLAPGRHVEDERARVSLGVLLDVPGDFPVRIKAARGGADGLTLILATETELRLGTPDDLDAKMAAAGAVLSSLPRSGRRNLAYVDVSLPQRPVVLRKHQVVSEG